MLETGLSEDSMLLLGGDMPLSAMGKVRDLIRVLGSLGGLALR